MISLRRTGAAPMATEDCPQGCDRCGGALVLLEEPTCRKCGWRDFSSEASNTDTPIRSLFGSARLFRVRYSGEHEALRGIVIDVRIIYLGERGIGPPGRPYGGHARVEYQPNCPYCSPMASMRKSGEVAKAARGKGITRYKCDSNHIIRLFDVKDDVITWG